MRQSALKSGCLLAGGEDRQMLVLGYQGTLQPGHDLCGVFGAGSGHTADGGLVSVGSPPEMERLIEPLILKGLLGFERRVPSGQRVFGGELIPLDALLGLLRERLRGILTLAVATHLESEEGSMVLAKRELMRVFPGLAPLLEQAVFEWVAATATFYERLQVDGVRLARWLGFASLPPVDSVSGTTSDTHPGGHLVLRIVFHGGRCVYYKPRSISGEWLWHRLLEIVAETEPALRLPAGKVLEGSGPARYGWAESVLFVDSARGGIEGSAARTEYWHVAGAMLSIAYHVCLTDLHLGNVLATPDGPVVTDAECLGTPRFVNSPSIGNSREDMESGAFLESLMSTGLLPHRPIGKMPDVSGLFGSAAPFPNLWLPQWTLEPGGRGRLAAVPAVLIDHRNAPGKVSMLTVLPQLLEGYRHAAGVLLRSRKALISSGSCWRTVLERDHAPRVVLRDTLSYGLLRSRYLEPRYLRSEHKRHSSLRSALQRNIAGNFPEAVVRAEVHALLHLHVPRLIALPGTRTLATGSGRSLVRGFAACTPAEAVLRRMEELSPERLESVHVPALILAALRAGGSVQHD